MIEKIRLNNAQWKMLLALTEQAHAELATETAMRTGSRRLRSFGLIAQTRTGREYLTEQGARRLSQGR